MEKESIASGSRRGETMSLTCFSIRVRLKNSIFGVNKADFLEKRKEEAKSEDLASGISGAGPHTDYRGCTAD